MLLEWRNGATIDAELLPDKQERIVSTILCVLNASAPRDDEAAGLAATIVRLLLDQGILAKEEEQRPGEIKSFRAAVAGSIAGLRQCQRRGAAYSKALTAASIVMKGLPGSDERTSDAFAPSGESLADKQMGRVLLAGVLSKTPMGVPITLRISGTPPAPLRADDGHASDGSLESGDEDEDEEDSEESDIDSEAEEEERRRRKKKRERERERERAGGGGGGGGGSGKKFKRLVKGDH